MKTGIIFALFFIASIAAASPIQKARLVAEAHDLYLKQDLAVAAFAKLGEAAEAGPRSIEEWKLKKLIFQSEGKKESNPERKLAFQRAINAAMPRPSGDEMLKQLSADRAETWHDESPDNEGIYTLAVLEAILNSSQSSDETRMNAHLLRAEQFSFAAGDLETQSEKSIPMCSGLHVPVCSSLYLRAIRELEIAASYAQTIEDRYHLQSKAFTALKNLSSMDSSKASLAEALAQRIVGDDYSCAALRSEFSDALEALDFCVSFLDTVVSWAVYGSADLAQAEKVLKSMLTWIPESHSGYSMVWDYLGMIYEQRNQSQEACVAFGKALDSFQDHEFKIQEGWSEKDIQFEKEIFDAVVKDLTTTKERTCQSTGVL